MQTVVPKLVQARMLETGECYETAYTWVCRQNNQGLSISSPADGECTCGDISPDPATLTCGETV